MFPVTLIRLSHPLFAMLFILGGYRMLDVGKHVNYSYHGMSWADHALPLAMMFLGAIGTTGIMFLHQAAMDDGDDSVLMRIVTVLTGYLPAVAVAIFGLDAIVIGFTLTVHAIAIPLLVMLAGLITLLPVLIRDFWA